MAELHAMDTRQSIRSKILVRTLLVLFLLALALGMTSFVVVQTLVRNDSEQLMMQKCEEEKLLIDDKLSVVRHSVTIINDYSNTLRNMNSFDVLSQDYLDQMCSLAISTAQDTNGAMAVYLRLNPEITGSGTSGFFWSKKSTDDEFTEEPPTDITAYDPADIEHVGWFYIPKQTDQPLWMAPYYNKNIDVLMISYIIPLYDQSNQFIGVVGMDIDFSTIIQDTSKIKLYKTGRVVLIDENSGTLYYCNNLGTMITDTLPMGLGQKVSTATEQVQNITTEKSGSEDYLVCFSRLSNDMVVCMNVPLSEVNAFSDNLMLVMSLVTLICAGIAALYVWRSTSTIVKPIEHLRKVTHQYAKGEWDEHYICQTGDELQDLSESISNMADQTKNYIDCLNNLAHFDSLTGIRNRVGYNDEVEIINSYRRGSFDHYAVCVMDLNYLKRANDNLGHDVGDALIKEASRYICSTFTHSAVFRIGGDEFVVIMRNEDYANRNQLLAAFEQGMGYDVHGAKLSISFGMATSDEVDTHNETFKLADERMYAKKAEMKRRDTTTRNAATTDQDDRL